MRESQIKKQTLNTDGTRGVGAGGAGQTGDGDKALCPMEVPNLKQL